MKIKKKIKLELFTGLQTKLPNLKKMRERKVCLGQFKDGVWKIKASHRPPKGKKYTRAICLSNIAMEAIVSMWLRIRREKR